MINSWLARFPSTPRLVKAQDVAVLAAWPGLLVWLDLLKRLAVQTTLVVFAVFLTKQAALAGYLSSVGVVAVRALTVTATTVLLWRGGRWRLWQDMGLHKTDTAWLDLAAGFLIMAIAQTVILATLLLTRSVQVQWSVVSWSGAIKVLAEALLLWALVAWGEELWTRGVWLQAIARGYWLARRPHGARRLPQPGAVARLAGALVSSLFFALMHGMNAHVSGAALVGIFIGGMFLAYGFVCSDALWLPIGMHLGWNLFEGTVYGFPVSGAGVAHLMSVSLTGPAWLTGGAFGPEAGVAAVPALLLAFVLIAAYTSQGHDGEQKKRCAARLKDSFVSLVAMIGFMRV